MPTYGAASYGTAMPAYGTAMPAYGATPTYGGYGAHAPMDASTVQTQLDDATSVLTTQFGVQEKMLTHQHEAQLLLHVLLIVLGRHLRDRAILLSFEHFQLRVMLVSEHLLLDTELRGEHRRRILQLRLPRGGIHRVGAAV